MTSNVKTRIVRSDGSVLLQNVKIGTIKFILLGVWSQIDTKLGTYQGLYYPKKTYLNIILSCSTNAMITQLQSTAIFMDKSRLDKPDSIDVVTNRLVIW